MLFTVLATPLLLAITGHAASARSWNASGMAGVEEMEQGVGSLLPCRLVYQDIVIISTINTECADVGLEDLPYHAMNDPVLLQGVRVTMGNCGYQTALVRSPTNCTLIFADDDQEEVISRTICDSLADPSLVLLCHIPVTIKMDQRALHSSLQKAADFQQDRQGCITCPATRSGTCPCCPGPGEPVILYKFMPHRQSDCACTQLGLTPLPLPDNPEWQREVARRLTDCTGRNNMAWVSGRPNSHGECPAFVPAGMVRKSNNVPIYKPAWRPCDTPLPVVCRAPTNPQDYACYQCRFSWSPQCCRCPGYGRSRARWSPRDVCFLPDVCATERSSSDSSCSSSDSDSFVHKNAGEVAIDWFATDCDYRSQNFDCDRCLRLLEWSQDSEDGQAGKPAGNHGKRTSIINLKNDHFLIHAQLTSREAPIECTKYNGILATISFDTIANIAGNMDTIKAWTAKGMYVKMPGDKVGSIRTFAGYDETRTAAALCQKA